MSQVLTPLDLRYQNGETWLLLANFDVVSDTLGPIRVWAGFRTDFNSVPRILTNILPREDYGEAGVVHDDLYQRGTLNGKPITRAQADAVHREFLVWGKAPAWKVRAMYWGLRIGGWVAWNAYRKNPPVANA